MTIQMLEPDIAFIRRIQSLGGDGLKKCLQCGACSVACRLAPDERPFPRKEMAAASWGLPDRLASSVDVWLCHQCGECSSQCPRGAGPSEVLAAVRAYAVGLYSRPRWLARAVNDPKMLLVLIAAPAVLFLVAGFITNALGLNWLNFSPSPDIRGQMAHGRFFSAWLVDLIFAPTLAFAAAVFLLGLKDFVRDMHHAALADGRMQPMALSWTSLFSAFARVVVPILRHDRFRECAENKTRAVSHMMVLYGFIGLTIVTAVFSLTLYGSMAVLSLRGGFAYGAAHALHGPHSQLNPVKWLANAAGIALVAGVLAMIKDRLAKGPKAAVSTYRDWFLIGLVLAPALTGLAAEMTRLAGSSATYFIYFVHLMSVWCLFAYLPFSKLAHLAYRTAAMAYAEWTGRGKK